MRRVLPLLGVLLAVALTGTAGTNRWWSHVEFLASDVLQGRDTGTPAHRHAADYVASQFRKAGLEPAGTAGFLQPVGFKSRRIVEALSSLALVHDGRTERLAIGDDAN